MNGQDWKWTYLDDNLLDFLEIARIMGYGEDGRDADILSEGLEHISGRFHALTEDRQLESSCLFKIKSVAFSSSKSALIVSDNSFFGANSMKLKSNCLASLSITGFCAVIVVKHSFTQSTI